MLTLQADDVTLLTWCIDAAYAMHPDCRGHSGAMLSMGKGAILGMYQKQKLNSWSSMESEVVAVDDTIAQVLWVRYF